MSSSTATPSAATAVAPSPRNVSASAMATPSPVPKISARKRATASTSRSLLESTADLTTPLRRISRDHSNLRDDDPSAVMVTGTLEVGSEENAPERVTIPRSAVKPSPQHIDRREHLTANKQKLLKLSLQAKQNGSSGSGSSPKKPQVVKNVFTRTFLAVILIAGMVTTIINMRSPQPTFQSITMEGQVAELEEILRKTTKMMQVQLDLVDMKIHKEIEGLKNELEDKIDEQATSFGTELRNMKAKTEDIEASLKVLTDAGYPTKHEVLSLITTVVEERAAQGSGEALSLDDVRAVARRLVEAELEKHAADGIGRVDYALASGGGKVVDHSEGFYHGLKGSWYQLAGGLLSGGSNRHVLANKVLEPSFGEPGQCLPLKGNNVYVEIALRTSIFPDSVSLEHVSKSVAYDVSSAPKDFRVFGWLDSFKKDDGSDKPVSQILLGEFTYDVEKKNVQTFSLPDDSRTKLINMIRLEVITNYGSPSHTCIYRFRVHGTDSKSVQPLSA